MSPAAKMTSAQPVVSLARCFAFFTSLLAVCLTGCATNSKPLGGGYYLRATHYFSWEPSGVRLSLFFRGAQGARIEVWKNLTGRIVVNDSVAVFEGTTRPAGEYKLFAVQDGAPCLEIGNAILAFQAEKEKTDVRAFMERCILATSALERTDHGLQLGSLGFTWEEIATVMQRVKAEGQVQKDGSGMSYLHIDYGVKQESDR